MATVKRCDPQGCQNEEGVETYTITPARGGGARDVDLCPQHREALQSLYDAGRPVQGLRLHTTGGIASPDYTAVFRKAFSEALNR